MRNGLSFELLMQLFFALECLSIWKVPRPQVKVNDFKAKESKTLDKIVELFGKQWDDFKKSRSSFCRDVKKIRRLQITSKILHYILPGALLTNGPQIPEETLEIFQRVEGIYKQCARFQRTSRLYRGFQWITKLLCSFVPMVTLSIAVIGLALFKDPSAGRSIRALNMLAAIYFSVKLAIVAVTVLLAHKYDSVLKEVEPVENETEPQGIGRC